MFEFCAAFRRMVNRTVEYSLGDDPETLGTMVHGDDDILGTIGEFARGTSFMVDWYATAARVFRFVQPRSSLFRVDWRGERAVGATLYMKFPRSPDTKELNATFEEARPFGWYGPCAITVGKALELQGPSGIALRVLASGGRHLAVYYSVEARGMHLAEFASRVVRAAELSCSPGAIDRDATMLARTCQLAVVGLDGGSPTSRGALKFDWGAVPLQVARSLIESKGTASAALTRFDSLSRDLRARWLSYLGVKYGSNGYVGWRAYFSTEPSRHVAVGRPRINVARPTSRTAIPHY